MLSPTNIISSRDFNNAWAKAINFVMKNKCQIIFGNPRGSKKIAYDSYQTITLLGHAIDQIERHETHPAYKFNGHRLKQYCNEFTKEFLNEYNKKQDIEKFDYTYIERLMQYKELINQLTFMKFMLKDQITSNTPCNFNQAITWYVEEDGGYKKSSPCLQRIWIRYYEPKYVDVHLSWRSRDLWGAWQSNMIAIIDMLNREVIKPCDCTILRIIDQNDSLHIYCGDWAEANKVIPQITYHG